MRTIKVRTTLSVFRFRWSDYKDIAGLLTNVDEELKGRGLELIMADAGGDEYGLRIERRRNASKRSRPRTDSTILVNLSTKSQAH